MKTRKWIISLALLSTSAQILAQDEPPGDALPPPSIASDNAAPLIAVGEEAAAARASAEGNTDGAGRPIPIPPKVEGEEPEAEVNIRRRGNQVIEEHSINGRVYMVKITPKNGIPYFFVDTDGDGRLESKIGGDVMEPVKPTQYKLLEWD